MGADEVEEKSFEETNDAATRTYNPESADLKTAYASRVDELGTEQAKRVADYLEDKARETSSWSVLKGLRMSIIDSGVSILRKMTGKSDQCEESGSDEEPSKPTESGRDTKPGKSTDGSNGAESPTELGGDWIDTMVNFAMDQATNPEALAGGDAGSKDIEGDSVAAQGKAANEPGAESVVEKGHAPEASPSEEPPTKVRYPDGKVNTITYDADNNPTKIETKDGPSWLKEGDHWQKHNSSGNPVGEPFYGDVKVDSAGTIRFLKDSSTVYEQRADGSALAFHANGNVVEINYPDGRVNVVSPDGSEITTKDGPTWRKEADGGWHKYNSDGSPSQSWDGEIIVTHTGDIQFNRKDGTCAHIEHTDGSHTDFTEHGATTVGRHNLDGTYSQTTTDKFGRQYGLDKDAKGKLTEIRHTNGGYDRIHYDSDGHESFIYHSDNSITVKDENTGKWVHVGNDGLPKEEFDKLSISEEGEIVYSSRSKEVQQHVDGTATTTITDSSGKSYGYDTDADGKITRVTRQSGKTFTIGYDSDGVQSEIHLPDDIIVKKEGDYFVERDKDGTETGRFDRYEVSPQGDLTAAKNGDTDVYHLDGRFSKKFADGSSYEWNAQKQITEVTRANGNTVKIAYDSEGRQSQFYLPEGCLVMKTGESYTEYDAQGTVTNRYDRYEVSAYGDITMVKNGDTDIYHPDGSFSKKFANGSSYERDPQKRVLEFSRPNDEKFSVEYDKDGNQSAIHCPDGHILKKEADCWKEYDSNDQVLKQYKSVSVDDYGDLAIQSDSSTVISDIDGSVSVCNSDGSAFKQNNKKQTTEVTYPSGITNKIEYDSEGNPIKVTNEHDQFAWLKQGDVWNCYDSTGQKVDTCNEITVGPNGDLSLMKTDGTGITQHADGSYERVNGTSKVMFRSDDLPAEITYPDGNRNSIVYEGNQPTAIQGTDGVNFTRAGDSWIRKDGKETTEGTLEIQPDGNIVFTATNGYREIRPINGPRTVMLPEVAVGD